MSAAVRERLCALDEMGDGTVRRFEVDDRRIAVVRIGDAVYAIGDVCTHQDVSLADGEVNVDDLTLECPKHGSEFSLESGEALSLPATRAVACYDVVLVDGDIWLTVDR